MLNQNLKELLLSTACFPPIEYMVHILKSDTIFIEKEETYPKQTWRNRYAIMSANGILHLSIPVKKPYGNKTKTGQVLLDNTSKWQVKQCRAIESAYRNAPFYIYYKDLIKGLFIENQKETLLIEWNTEILKSILNEFGIDKKINYTKEFVLYPEDKTDLRYAISPKNKNYTIKSFSEYIQVFSYKYGFIKNLSIIDLIFNIGPEVPEYLSKQASGISQPSK